MIYLEAVLDLHPDKVGVFMDIFAKEYMPALVSLGRKFMGQWTCRIGPRWHVVNLWAHEDMAELQRFWQARDQSKEVTEIMTRLTPCIQSETVKLLIPSPISPLK